MTIKDEKGRKLRIKVMIRKRLPMTKEGYDQWGYPAKGKISKSKLTWNHYANPPDIFQDPDEPFRNGKKNITVPVELLATNEAIKNFILDNFHVEDGDHLVLQGQGHAKTMYHSGFGKHMVEIRILNVEQRKVDVIPLNRFDNRWFRREAKKV